MMFLPTCLLAGISTSTKKIHTLLYATNQPQYTHLSRQWRIWERALAMGTARVCECEEGVGEVVLGLI